MTRITLGDGRFIMQVEGEGVLAVYKTTKALPLGNVGPEADAFLGDCVLEIEGTTEGFQVLLSTILGTMEVLERNKLKQSLAV